MAQDPSLFPKPSRFTLSVSGRVLLFTIVVWVGLLAGLHVVLSKVFRPTFVSFESELLVKDLERVEAAVAREIEQLGRTAKDYASWEDMRQYLSSTEATEVPRSLKLEMLKTLDLTSLFVFDEFGRVKHTLTRKDPAQLAHDKEYTPQGFANHFPVIASVRSGGIDESTDHGGLVRFGSGALVLAVSAPVFGDDGRPHGSVVLLRELDHDAVERLADQVRLPLVLEAATPANTAPTAEKSHPKLDGATISAEAWLRDPFGQPIARYSVSREANILGQGEDTLSLAGLGSLGMLSLVLAMLLLLLHVSVVRPLRFLTQNVERVRATEDLSLRMGLTRQDEIGLLAFNFDRLLALLEDRTRVLEELATTDGLTKLLNRRTVIERLEKEMVNSRENKQSLSVLLLDIDHFKRINDTAGHNVGDRVLRAVAEAMPTVVPKTASIGRYGGEEFLVLLPGQGRKAASEVAELIRSTIAECSVQGLDWPVTVSVGVASWIGHTMHGLLATADMNLYRAKEGGRNQVVADDIPLSKLPAASIPPPAKIA